LVLFVLCSGTEGSFVDSMTGEVAAHSGLQVGQAPIEVIVTDGSLHLPPDRLHRIEPGGICGQKMKLEAARMAIEVPFHLGTGMDDVVVQHQMQPGPIPLAQGLQALDELATALAVAKLEAELGACEVEGTETMTLLILAGSRDAILPAPWLPVIAQQGLQIEVAFVQEQQPLPGMPPNSKGLLQAVDHPFFRA
jgi:hypothetical protein